MEYYAFNVVVGVVFVTAPLAQGCFTMFNHIFASEVWKGPPLSFI